MKNHSVKVVNGFVDLDYTAILMLINYGATTESCLDDVLETFENYREFLGCRGGSPCGLRARLLTISFSKKLKLELLLVHHRSCIFLL
jgi:hypothetical protein